MPVPLIHYIRYVEFAKRGNKEHARRKLYPKSTIERVEKTLFS